MDKIVLKVSPSTHHKAVAALVAATIFACLGAVTALAVGRPVEVVVTNGLLIGTGVGLFEEFYVHSHPLRSIPIHVGVIAVLYLASTHITHLLLGRLDDLPTVYRRLPYALAVFHAVFSRRRFDDADHPLHWARNAFSPPRWELSPSRAGPKGAAFSRYQ